MVGICYVDRGGELQRTKRACRNSSSLAQGKGDIGLCKGGSKKDKERQPRIAVA